MLTVAAAWVVHLILYWNGQFSKSESRWVGAFHEVHRRVGHASCLEIISKDPDTQRVVITTEDICNGL